MMNDLFTDDELAILVSCGPRIMELHRKGMSESDAIKTAVRERAASAWQWWYKLEENPELDAMVMEQTFRYVVAKLQPAS